ncbi:MAG: hypothetical protein ABI977_36000 [Acidobacteriota bacterium]
MRLLLCSMIFCILTAGALFTAEAQRNAETAQRLPIIYWAQGIETAAALKQAGIEQIAAPPENLDAWRKAGFNVIAISQPELERREKLLAPRTAGRADVASATRRPWIDSNGWRFVRESAGKFYYNLTEKGVGRAALAAAEAFAYQADAILKIDPADLAAAGKMLAFLRALPPGSLPPVADIGLIDDGSPATGEVMNLLTRRNLLFKLVPAPAPQFRVNIKLGSKAYPLTEASDPSAFAQKVRQQLGDENRSLRIYGTEVVVSRLTSDGARAQLHLLNYSGRDVDSLRVRLRGKYGKAELKAFGIEPRELEDFVVADGATEFTVTRLGAYAVIQLTAGQ